MGEGLCEKIFFLFTQKSNCTKIGKVTKGVRPMVLKNMINVQLMMFLLVIVGFIVRKTQIVGSEGRKNLINLCLYVTLPFNIANAFLGKFSWDMLVTSGLVLLLSVGFNLVSILIAFLLYRKEDKEQKTLCYGTIVSNGSFLGNPVIEGVYGSTGLFYNALFMLPVRVVVWTVGISVFLKGEKVNLWKKVLLHPCVVAMYIGAIFILTGVRLPGFLEETISGISGSNTPLSMMLVGMMLAEMNPKGLFRKNLFFYTFVRLILIPAVILAITAKLPIDPMLRGIAVIIAGMPTPITTVLLASKYGGDEECATGMIFMSTVLSMITLPLLCLFI